MTRLEIETSHIEGKPHIRRIAESVSKLMVKETLIGTERLQKVRLLLAEGKRLWLLPNHLSNLDAPLIEGAIRRAGFADIADRIVMLMGIKMQREWLSRFVSSGYGRIDIWSPTTEVKDQMERSEKRQMLENALRAIPAALDRGKVVLMSLEAGRSRSKALTRARAELAGYFHREDYILPVGIWGSEKALPVGSRVPQFFKRVAVHFGDPFPIGPITDKVRVDPRVSRKQEIVDAIAGDHIAPLLPIEYQGVYKDRVANSAS